MHRVIFNLQAKKLRLFDDFFKSFETIIVKEKEAFYEKLFIAVIDDLNLNPSANNTKKEYQIINPKIVLTVSIN